MCASCIVRNMDALSIVAANQNLHMWQHSLGTDKEWPHNYLSGLYSRKFVKEHKLHDILEIGFANGASLALWSCAFPDSKIVGVDINPIKNPHPALRNANNVEIILSDAYDQNFVEHLGKTFDLIIDDGPHTVESQVKALRLYAPLLNPDGILIIEDISGGLRTAREIRKQNKRKFRKNLVYYDFRNLNNHFDNCLIAYYDNSLEARNERKRQGRWNQIAFVSPVRLPSSLAIKFQWRRLIYGIRYRTLRLLGRN